MGLAVALTLAFFLFAAAMASFFGSISTLERTSQGDPTPQGLPFAFFGIFIGEMLLFAAGIAQAITTGFWLMRAAENVQGRGVLYASWSPGWGVASWFIPYGNMVLPFLVCREVWRGSQSTAPQDPAWKQRPVPAWLNWWWALAIAAPVATMITIMGAGIAAAVTRSVAPLFFLVVPLGLWILALLLFVRFVRRLTDIQEGWGA